MNQLNFSATSGHATAFFRSPLANVYEYDPADDGPEVEVISRILTSHPGYVIGEERIILEAEADLQAGW